MTWVRTLLCLLLLIFPVLPARAQAPATISYQSYLTTAAGQAVTTPVAMTFSLYADPTGGTPLWSEHHASEPVHSGAYSVLLGSVTPLTVLPFDTVYYLGVAIGSDPEMTPRQTLSSVPSSFRALVADRLGQVCADGDVLKYTASTSSWSCTTLSAGSGVPSATILNGSSNPGAALGNDGDVYFNTASSSIFGPKHAGVWPAGVPLVGPPGPAGSQGPSGPSGPTGPAGPGITWNNISGTSQAAQPNVGYIASNVGLTSITLPAAPAVGDKFSVVGAGAGGWQVNANAGQALVRTSVTNAVVGDSWTFRIAGTCSGVASSSDGSKLVAVNGSGSVITSADSGVTWASRGNFGGSYWSTTSVASSGDGTKLVLAGSGAPIYTSTDSGATWVARDTPRSWTSVASSSDGTKVVATVSSGQIYVSTDSGANWSARESVRGWRSVASSSDGSRLFASGGTGIYASADFGTTWTLLASTAAFGDVYLACSSDGSKVVVAGVIGSLYVSKDFGVSWTVLNGASFYWTSAAMSSDGSKLAVTSNMDWGQMTISRDFGLSWSAGDRFKMWHAVALSSDGEKMAACDEFTGLFTSNSDRSTSSTEITSVTGPQWSTLELMYLGNNRYLITGGRGW